MRDCVTKYYVKFIMLEFKIHYENIIYNSCLLTCLCTDKDIAIIDKYEYHEKQAISEAILLLRATIISNKLLRYMICLCNYTVVEWQLLAHKLKTNNIISPIISKHIKPIIIYDKSLRNTWILSCITYTYT